MKIIYMAKDGTEFNNKEECIEYEELHNYESLLLMDNNFEETLDGDAAYACLLRSEKEVEIMTNFCEDYGVIDDGIETPGLYIWLNDMEVWRKIEEEYEDIAKRTEYLNKTKDFFKKYDAK